MNRYLFAGLIALAGLAPTPLLNAQAVDSYTTGFSKDSLPWPATNRNSLPPVRKPFPYKSSWIPASFIVYGLVSMHTDAFQDVNETVKEEVYTERQPGKLHLDNYLQYTPAVAVYALSAVGLHGKNNFRDRTIIYGISNLVLGGIVNSVKRLTGETRPDGSDNLSFPSGHAATAFAAAEFLRQEYAAVSPLYGIAGYAAATATAYLRISNNKHWMGDVVAGAGLGILSTRLAYWIYPRIKRKLFKGKELHTIFMPGWQNGTWGLGMAHLF